MTRTCDDRHDAATAPVMYGSSDGIPAERPTPHPLDHLVGDDGRRIIDRSVILWLAKRTLSTPDGNEPYGRALVGIAKAWWEAQQPERGVDQP